MAVLETLQERHEPALSSEHCAIARCQTRGCAALIFTDDQCELLSETIGISLHAGEAARSAKTSRRYEVITTGTSGCQAPVQSPASFLLSAVLRFVAATYVLELPYRGWWSSGICRPRRRPNPENIDGLDAPAKLVVNSEFSPAERRRSIQTAAEVSS